MEFNKFSDIPVHKPNIEEIKTKFLNLTEKLKNAKDGKEAIAVTKEYFHYSDEVNSNIQIIHIRYTINVLDKKYEELVDFINENAPYIDEASNAFEMELYNSKFRKELEEEFGSHFFNQVAAGLKVFSPEIIEDLQEENRLATSYDKLMGSALIDYEGEKLPVTKISAFFADDDRNVRAKSTKAYFDFLAAHDEEIGAIYDGLVKVRDRIAKKLGFKDFVEVGYLRLGRVDYDEHDVENYRKQIVENIVPLSEKLFERQAKRLKFDDIKFYDYNLGFLSGNAKPIGTPDELVKKAQAMYKDMNEIPSHYFNFMVDHELFDLVSKEGKQPGGYMDYIPSIKSSFIFSNFNGTDGDVEVLTHEFGHALQGFLSADIEVPSYRSPGYEACEIHSTSMEFMTYPWMDSFFGANADKYRFSHLANAITFIPYGASIDEFQHFVYKNPNATHAERKAKYREIEKKYLPHKHYGEGYEHLEEGGFWMRQGHIYGSPFYYIDYTIAHVCAFEFFVESLKDFDKTFDKYIRFSKLGGTLPFKALLKEGGLENPFDNGTIEHITPTLEAYLDKFDDFNM